MKNKNDIDKFIKLVKQLKSLMSEFSVLSKKKPDDAINKFKLKLINPILESANYFVNAPQYKPFEGFELFDEDGMPTNSDVLVILSQYLACLAKYHKDNIKVGSDYNYYWTINNKITQERASENFSQI